MWHSGLTPTAIAVALDRSRAAVDHRSVFLNLPRRQKTRLEPEVKIEPEPEPDASLPQLYEDDPRATTDFSAPPKAPPQDVTARLMGDPIRRYPAELPAERLVSLPVTDSPSLEDFLPLRGGSFLSPGG